MKKILIYVLVISLLLCCTMSGCSSSQKNTVIRDGFYYSSCDRNGVWHYNFYNENDSKGYRYEIDGDKAYRYIGNTVDYKADIVEIDGEIYFYGYKWRGFFWTWKEYGSETIFKITYKRSDGRLYVTYYD